MADQHREPFYEIERAVVAAMAHLEADPFPDDECRWVLSEPRRLSDGWYFDYRFERIDGLPTDGAGGAPGYLVALHDGSVRTISNEEYGDRKLWLEPTIPLPPQK